MGPLNVSAKDRSSSTTGLEDRLIEVYVDYLLLLHMVLPLSRH